jgi:methionine-rich copper-binding protein CopC
VPRPHRISLAAALAVATAGLLVLGAVPASAHTELVRTVPADGSTVTTPPDQLRLVLN